MQIILLINTTQKQFFIFVYISHVICLFHVSFCHQCFSSRLSTALWSSRGRSKSMEEVDQSPVRTVGSPAKGRRSGSRTNTSTSSALSVKVCNSQLSTLTSILSSNNQISHSLGKDCIKPGTGMLFVEQKHSLQQNCLQVCRTDKSNIDLLTIVFQTNSANSSLTYSYFKNS